jgi:3-deoxy-D-manno-octulosonate 8-phosphate phosphatase (KDO 8-P phosphatase)
MTALPASDIVARLKRIDLLLLDVDGVLTDGRLYFGADGETLKAFHVRDGVGLKLLRKEGIQVGIVTGRKGPALAARCRELNIEMVFDGVADKAAALEAIVAQTGLPPDRMAFVGDDLPDLPLMAAVGLSVAVADADEAVRRAADWITEAPGGRGAVREVCRLLLDARGRWETVLDDYRGPR